MTQADRVHSTPPINTPIADDPVHAATETYRPAFPPRAPTPQERGDELLMQWRLARAAGIPATNRLDREGPAMPRELHPIDVLADLLGSGDFPVQIADPDAAAKLILERLNDAGFKIVPAAREDRT